MRNTCMYKTFGTAYTHYLTDLLCEQIAFSWSLASESDRQRERENIGEGQGSQDNEAH